MWILSSFKTNNQNSTNKKALPIHARNKKDLNNISSHQHVLNDH